MLKNINDVKNIFISKQWIEFILSENSGSLSFISLGDYKLPIIICKKFGFKVGGSPLRGWGTSKLSLLSDHGEDIVYKNGQEPSLNYSELAENLKPFKLDHYEFSLGTNLPLPRSNFKLINRNTYILNLPGSEDDGWKNLGKKTRNMVRKAEKNDVIVTFSEDKDWITKYWEILEITFSKNKLKVPFPISRLSNLKDKLGSSNILFVGAYKENKMIAGAVIPYNKYKMVYLTGAANPGYFKYAPNNLIQWEIIKFGIKNNISLYDMYGGGQGSIGRFKKSFGSNYYEFHHAVYENSLIFKTLLKFYPNYVKLKGLF